jgi:hypothetical protein
VAARDEHARRGRPLWRSRQQHACQQHACSRQQHAVNECLDLKE